MTKFERQWEADRDAAYDAADAEYERASKAAKTDQEISAAYAKYQAAHKAVGERFDRLWDEHEGKQDKQSKQAERERVAANFELARKLTEAATPPTVFISPQQAAARVGLTMPEFWSRVRSGVYPAPNDAGVYDADTVARLPRPKVKRRPAQRETPHNVLTDIFRF